MTRKFLFVLPVVLPGIVMTACKPQQKEPAAAAAIAVVNGTPMTTSFIMDSFRSYPSNVQNIYRRPGGQKHLLSTLIQQRLVILQALKEQGSKQDVAMLNAVDAKKVFNDYMTGVMRTKIRVTPEEIDAEKRRVSAALHLSPEAQIPDIAVRAQQRKMNEWLSSVGANAQVEIDQKALESLSLR